MQDATERRRQRAIALANAGSLFCPHKLVCERAKQRLRPSRVTLLTKVEQMASDLFKLMVGLFAVGTENGHGL